MAVSFEPTDGHDISDFEATTVEQQYAFGAKEVDIEAADDVLALNTSVGCES